MSLGNKIKQLRIESNIKQSELGNKLGFTKSTISLYESGKTYPDYDTLIELSKMFNVSTDYLLGISNDRSIVNMDRYLGDKIISLHNELKHEKIEDLFEDVSLDDKTRKVLESILGSAVIVCNGEKHMKSKDD